ncbi:hypothetical protein GPECTOR_11g36 [Gonium pectorale]|uniref:Neurotransmitter-gated ion-channel transmembrane domain-containing protein n=1 Tax=Gonium pectorale TaxID=33097 RepID=A0A150GQ87_GONPE|nr:hypothetical protein GPECTOR_11g36 [Gonium pectorale]|eukprot:KXZ51908.1 hypothetical protein GPECTOR_11g36 [Gonium pectorale]
MELTSVNTVSQQFDCKVWIQFKWHERGPQDPSAIADWKPAWSPNVDFQNMIDVKTLDAKPAHLRTQPQGCGPVAVYSRIVLQGTFAERFECRQFPMDCQRLHIRAVLWYNPEAVEDVPMSQPFGDSPAMRTIKFESGSCQVYMDSFVQQDSWIMYDRIIVKQGLTDARRNDDGLRFTTLNIYVCLRRKLGFYGWNIMLPIFLLVTISFASFFFEASALSDRLNLTLVVLLTLVAFKFVVSQYLPAASYLTYMDMYLVASFSLVFLVALQNLVAYIIEDPGRASAFNRWSGCALAAAWGVLHVLVLPLAAWRVQRQLDRTQLADDSDGADDKELEPSPL